MIRHKAGKILQRVERLPAVANHKANVVPRNGDQRAVLLLLHVEAHVVHAHEREDPAQIFHGGVGRRLADKGPHLGRAAAEEAEGLFHRKLQNLEFRFPGLDSKLTAGGFSRLFNGISGADCFFHDHLGPTSLPNLRPLYFFLPKYSEPPLPAFALPFWAGALFFSAGSCFFSSRAGCFPDAPSFASSLRRSSIC